MDCQSAVLLQPQGASTSPHLDWPLQTDPALRANPFPKVTNPFCQLPFIQYHALLILDMVLHSVNGLIVTDPLGLSD